MKLTRSITQIYTALLLSVATCIAQPQPAGPSFSDPAIEKAVLAANAEMIAAANSLNVDAFFDFIVDTDRGMIVQNGAIFRTRAEAYDAVKRGLQGVAKIERRFDNPQVTVISPETALLVSEGSVTATLEDGRVFDRRFAVSLVFVRRDGRWKILHGHYSSPIAGM
jgi:ketosteroid isomerase-like protein